MAKILVIPQLGCVFGSSTENCENYGSFLCSAEFPLLVMLIQLKLSAVTKGSLILLLHCSHMVNFYSYNYSCFICYPSRAWLRHNNIAQQGCLFSQNISLRLFVLSPTNQISHWGAHPPKSSVVSGAGRLPLSKQFNEYLPIYVCLRKTSGVAS